MDVKREARFSFYTFWDRLICKLKKKFGADRIFEIKWFSIHPTFKILIKICVYLFPGTIVSWKRMTYSHGYYSVQTNETNLLRSKPVYWYVSIEETLICIWFEIMHTLVVAIIYHLPYWLKVRVSQLHTHTSYWRSNGIRQTMWRKCTLQTFSCKMEIQITFIIISGDMYINNNKKISWFFSSLSLTLFLVFFFIHSIRDHSEKLDVDR